MQGIDNKKVGERLRQIEGSLRLKSRRAWALAIEADPSFFDKIVKGQATLTETYADALQKKFGVNKEWVFHGVGDPVARSYPKPATVDQWLEKINSNLEKLLQGQDDILIEQKYTRAEVRGVARYLVIQDSGADDSLLKELWGIYRKAVGGGVTVNDQKDIQLDEGN